VAKKKPATETTDQLNFEDALKRLEEIVHLLEEGEIGLNEALARYEEGVRLLRKSYKLLQHAERRIELLSGFDADGNPSTRPFDESQDATLQEKAQGRSRRRSISGNPGKMGDTGQTDVDAAGGLS